MSQQENSDLRPLTRFFFFITAIEAQQPAQPTGNLPFLQISHSSAGAVAIEALTKGARTTIPGMDRPQETGVHQICLEVELLTSQVGIVFQAF